MRGGNRVRLTTPDLVLLSLLAERAMHGYDANLELNRREVRHWAGISRPQVYYSLKKLAKAGMVRSAEGEEPPSGPERQIFEISGKGKKALADALERPDWTMQRDRPPFLTWMVLSWQARPGVLEKQLRRRREFLQQELRQEEDTLRSVLAEVGHPYHEAVWVVKLMIAQFKAELKWLDELSRQVRHRTPARHPRYASEREG
jgi:DNA-binding PadR family transcriptional regulator